MKPAAFNRILARAKGTVHEHVLNEVTLRTQAQAVYAPENVGHFGLNLARYAHFTSPIRRYADLVVHRALIRALKLGEGGLTDGELARLTETAEHISMTERRAMTAERDSVDRYVAAFMEDRVGAVFDARISGVTRFGLFVRLGETGADGLLPMRALGAEFFRHDEKRHALVGSRTHTAYKFGDKISVRLAEAAPLTGGLRFDLPSANAANPNGKRMPATADELAAIYLEEGGIRGAYRPGRGRRDADRGAAQSRRAARADGRAPPAPRLPAGQAGVSRRAARPRRSAARACPRSEAACAQAARMRGHDEQSRARACARRHSRDVRGNRRVDRRRNGIAPRTRSPSWRRFFSHGVVPRLDMLELIGRAITPPGRPRRYDTRFFVADASAIAHTLDAEHRSDELLDPVWLTIAEARAAKIMGITRLMLGEVEARLRAASIRRGPRRSLRCATVSRRFPGFRAVDFPAPWLG